jgi:RNA polymerase sigma factor (sigma-70 family)
MGEEVQHGVAPRGAFPGTRVSVLRAAAGADDAVRRQAWDHILGAYWKPVYKYLRLRWRLGPEDAEDLTQSFFTRALEKPFFAAYDPERARFRTFLRACLDAHAANHHRDATRQRRGGGRIALDFTTAENELARAAAPDDPDALFHREFLRRVVEQAVEALRAQCAGTPRAAAFEVFRRRDLAPEDGQPPPSYADLARDLDLPVTQVTNHLAAMRRALRAEVLRSLRALTASNAEFDAEARPFLGGPR